MFIIALNWLKLGVEKHLKLGENCKKFKIEIQPIFKNEVWLLKVWKYIKTNYSEKRGTRSRNTEIGTIISIYIEHMW